MVMVDMLELVTPIRIYTAPGMDYNIDRCREYVVRCLLPSS